MGFAIVLAVVAVASVIGMQWILRTDRHPVQFTRDRSSNLRHRISKVTSRYPVATGVVGATLWALSMMLKARLDGASYPEAALIVVGFFVVCFAGAGLLWAVEKWRSRSTHTL